MIFNTTAINVLYIDSLYIFTIIMTSMATPLHPNPSPGGHEIYNFGRPILGHHYYILSMSEPCPGVKNKTFLVIPQFYNFYPQILSPWGGGVMKFKISCVLTIYMLHNKESGRIRRRFGRNVGI